jgi:DNA-binding MarR family transcriptional regulator
LSLAIDRLRAAWRSNLGISAYEMLAITSVVDGPRTIGELGAILALSSGAMTGLVDRLEGQGRLVRVRDERDRRRVHLSVTDATRRELDELAAPLRARIERLPASGETSALLAALVGCYTETLEELR